MTEWNTLRARFPDDEFNEIERIKEQYGLSYNEIIRSGVKFYVKNYLEILLKKKTLQLVEKI